MKERPTFRLTLEALPSPDGVPVIIRLRHFLKRALRDWQLKCVHAVEVKPEQAQEPDHDKP